MGIRGCWTCRERKIRCDSHWPRCGNCTKARRVCQGYGIQLSWPRHSDRKRAIISRDTRRTVNTLPSNVKGFLNTSSWDISLSDELEKGRISARYLRTMRVPRPTYLSPIVLNREESHLLGFFNESRSLILGPTDEKVLTQFILTVAFSDPSDVTNPVLQGVFALASLQLHGSLESFRYKRHVMSSVKESINGLDEKTLLQTLMATMLLYHYELSLESNRKGNWVIFLCLVKKIINTSPAIQKLVRQEYSVFLDWIYYHEVLGEFTVRHWKVPYEGCSWAPTARSPRTINGSSPKMENTIGCPTDVLQLVVHTCRRALVANHSETNHANAGIERMNMLEQNISMVIGNCGPIHIPSATQMDRNMMVADLHRLACLIYVNRTVHCVSGTEFRHRRLVREGILLLTKMVTCQNAWPLFIIACEAVDDAQRLAILDVFEQSRQDRRRRSSHIHLIQHMVEAVWNQHDLNVDNQVDYLTIFNAVVAGVPFMPPFA
ncbi:fungal-specific transcription factor domain-containing protein [Exophiala viscosa]|uniref:Fungal-specific transcription factor domain-containing protein n=1 Tax=Exophiala viscosa TaxID=2486360 RepID=A0AAN6DVE3_9EURO|nr:fungal-specific transcription factor domain-containing protein [Exophiala viscosa]